MDFIGSKFKLNEWMFDIIKHYIPKPKNLTFLDGCTGSGIVSQFAASKGFDIISNDIMAFPRAIVNGSIGLTLKQRKLAKDYIELFKTLEGIEGFFFQTYSENGKDGRLYFTGENGKLIDRIRKEIEGVSDSKVKDYLLYCGVEAISRVSNTSGTHGAYLKKIKDRARTKFELREEHIENGNVIAFNQDLLKLLKCPVFRSHHKEDILYIDPPYNHRQYPANYHLYETFVKYDNPNVSGVTGLRNYEEDGTKSLFCSKKTCKDFLKQVIVSTRAEYVFISYNSEGILSIAEMKETLPSLEIVGKQPQKRFKSDSSEDREYRTDDLFEFVLLVRPAFP